MPQEYVTPEGTLVRLYPGANRVEPERDHDRLSVLNGGITQRLVRGSDVVYTFCPVEQQNRGL